MTFYPDLSFPADSFLKKVICPLSEEQTHTTLILNAFLENQQAWQGPLYHKLMGKWAKTGLCGEIDLWGWLKEESPAKSFSTLIFDRARKQAETWQQRHIWIARWHTHMPPSPSRRACPQVLFGCGIPDWNWPWLSVFNSRKPRLVFPDEEWLTILRAALPRIASDGVGFASSLGTLTYDLVSACSHSLGSPLLLVHSDPIEELLGSAARPLLLEGISPHLLLSCRTKAVTCSKYSRNTCRDRLLAFFADFHLVLLIRSNGNLLSTLMRQQLAMPRFQQVYLPRKNNSSTKGNFELLERFPKWARSFTYSDSKQSITQCLLSTRPAAASPRRPTSLKSACWQNYLYHYTRACPGPWPGQTYTDYLLSLQNDDPLSAHTAVDTLIHIVLEGYIRATSKLIRGGHKTISFTSLPPLELEKIRKWNSALIRWTFEPHGFAISRQLLKKCGAMPTIYSRQDVYPRLRPSERFRFQRHEVPHCQWKHEREWRLARDFKLDQANPGECFLFVDTPDDAQRIDTQIEFSPPVIVLRD